MELSEKVAYIKGLAEGLGVDESSKEGRVMGLIIDLLKDMAVSIEDLEHDYTELSDQLEIMDEDLSSLEDEFYEDDECGCGCGCDCDHDDDGFYELTCPSCDETFYADTEDLEKNNISCPSCSEAFEISIENDDDEDID